MALMKDLSARAREGLEEFNAQHGASTARKRGRPRPQSLCYRFGLHSTQRAHFRHLRRVRIVKLLRPLFIKKALTHAVT